MQLLSDFRPALIGVPLVIAWIAFVYAANRKAHPKVLFSLFLVELWERFSYYGMRAFLVLYLANGLITGGLGFADGTANSIYAAYGALVYLTPILGGFLADRYWGSRKAIIWGAILMALGQFTLAGGAFLADPSETGNQLKQFIDDKSAFIERQVSSGLTEADATAEFDKAVKTMTPVSNESHMPDDKRKLLLYLGLAMLTLGNGFFKPNISSMIGRFYAAGDARRDGAFTIFYMGINIGAFISPLVCGTFAQKVAWGYGFLAAGIGMILGLLLFLHTSRSGLLEDKADAPKAPANGHRIFGIPADSLIVLGSLVLLPLLMSLMVYNHIMDVLLIICATLIIGYLFYVSKQFGIQERQRIWVIVVLLLFTTIFWAFFELAGGALNIFTDKNVAKSILGFPLETSNFQALNALFIMIFAPIFAVMWVKLSKHNAEPSSPVKFAIGLALVGVGFFLLLPGKSMAINGMIPGVFLAALYLSHTLGELALSPVGLSLVTKLAPEKVGGLMMGAWFLSSSLAHQAGKWIGKFMFDESKAEALSPAESLQTSLSVLTQVGLVAIGSAALLLCLSPLLKKWMHGVK